MDSKSQKPVSVPSYGNTGISLENLTADEADKLRGMVRGHWWARGMNGRIDFIHGMEMPSAPTEDEMLPQWRKPIREEREEEYQHLLLDPDCNLQYSSPSILIQHLCGYSYTPQGYKANAEFLEACGFACMRSRRGDEGLFWEIWFLPGLWAAKGRMKEAIRDMVDDVTMDKVLNFIRSNVSFGTLDIAVQRMCQVLD